MRSRRSPTRCGGTCWCGWPPVPRGSSTSPPATRSAAPRSAGTCGCSARPTSWSRCRTGGSATTGCARTASRACGAGWRASSRARASTRRLLDGLDLEVRRTVRERRADRPTTRRRPDEHRTHRHPRVPRRDELPRLHAHLPGADHGRLGGGHRAGPARALDRHLVRRSRVGPGRLPDDRRGPGGDRPRPTRSTRASHRVASRCGTSSRATTSSGASSSTWPRRTASRRSPSRR